MKQTIETLRRYNEWRRDNEGTIPQPDPKEIGEAIDDAVRMLEESEKQRKQVNEFIIDIANMLNMDTDGIGYDGLILSIDDFQDAINSYRR